MTMIDINYPKISSNGFVKLRPIFSAYLILTNNTKVNPTLIVVKEADIQLKARLVLTV